MASYTTLQETTPTMGAIKGNMNVGVKVLGGREAAAAIRKLTPVARRAMLKEFEKQAWKVIRTAQNHYVPVLSGDLVFSGDVIVHPGRYPSVEFGFGGKARAYAVIQHENTEFEHPSGGQAKYLSTPVNRAKRTIMIAVGEKIRAEFRKFDTRRFE